MLIREPGSVLQMRIAVAALSVALAAGLAACGGGGGGDASTPPVAGPQPPTTPAPPADPAAAPEIRLAAGYTDVLASIGFSQPNWPAWRSASTAAVDGVGCYKNENYHIHSLVSIYRNGVRLALPDSVGRGSGCTYELHTHDISGVIHVETDVQKPFTLGQFFSLWGQPLGAAAVAGLPGTPTYYLVENEKITRVTTDPAAILLAPHREIVIVTGTPPAEIPRYSWTASGL